MALKQYYVNDNIALLINGDLDAAAVQELRPKIEEVIASAQNNVLIDLSQVDFIDSSGIGVLVFMYKRLREQKKQLALVGVKGQPQKMLNVLRIDKTIDLYASFNSYLEANNQVKPLGVGVGS